MKKLLSILLCGVMGFTLSGFAHTPNKVLAQENKKDSRIILEIGMCGTTQWYVEDDGTNVILNFDSGTLDAIGYNTAPWEKYKPDIQKVVFKSPVQANADSSYLFYNLIKVKTFENLNL